MRSCITVLWLLAAAPAALAQQPTAEPPPAVPAPAPRAAEELPLAIPSGQAQAQAVALDEARAFALRQYRMRFLAVRSWSELHSSTVYSDVGYGYGYGYGGFGTGVTIASPMIWSEERWSVYRGPQRLNNAQYLEVIGAQADRADLEGRIRKNRTVAGVFYGIAIAGGAATIGSLVGMDNAQKPRTWRMWRGVGLGGISGLFVGAVSGSFPTARARRLSSDPTLIRDWDALQNEMIEHNEGLRKDLGLSAEDALKVEGAH